MKVALLCLCLASTTFAAPFLFTLLLHVSVQSFPTQGFIKYSIPQPPGRQSVEVYYPYDFAQQRIIANMPPMSNVPHSPNVRQISMIKNTSMLFCLFPLPSQDPLNQAQQDQPIQSSQVDSKAHVTYGH
uniref:Secretory calcium-binding phosphoprotein 5 n=1 Tax=Periophthalmus magnuspinnatus TaxID=409849 RepID=A0A3B3ZQK5_9GOBI